MELTAQTCKPQLHIFTDGSTHPQSKIGYGAYLAITDLHVSCEKLQNKVQVKRFENTTSTQLELQTLLWALNDTRTAELDGAKLTIYTDSQNIITLPTRQHRLEQQNYISHNSRKLKNTILYQHFFSLRSVLDFQLVKVNGHKPSSDKNTIDRLFGLVDKASRHALRTALASTVTALKS